MENQLAIKKDSLEESVYQIQSGNHMLLNKLLQAYKPFIAKCVSEVCKRYIDPTKDDEFSIGFFGFYEAITCYSNDKGSSFLSFARLVIKRKTIDYIRKESTRPTSLSIDETYDEEKLENPIEISVANRIYQTEQDEWNRRQEIHLLAKKLKQYKLSFRELVEASPKHSDARATAIGIAHVLYHNTSMRMFVYKKKQLPMKQLVEQVDVSKKTLERNRKYILAIFIILDSDFVYLQDFLKQ